MVLERNGRVEVRHRAVYDADRTELVGGSKVGCGERGEIQSEALGRREAEKFYERAVRVRYHRNIKT